ncbi:MAG: IS21-like element helper ATPase IstB [Verrucomicrobia bacterium]|nr:IS21-like element helper ATPase IstB [Verrucomicrobiota bacterium]
MSAPASMPMMLRALRLPSVLSEYESLAQQATREDWTYERYLSAVVECELHARAEKRTERLLKCSGLPAGKSLDTLDTKPLPAKVRRQIPALIDGGFVERAENVLAFGLPGRGKTHLVAAIARELILQHGTSVLFTTSFHLVQRLLVAKRDLTIEALLKKLDRFELVILDDIGYVQQSREEMEVLFTFLSERYERRSLMITSNLVFSEWDKIFKDPMTTAAAIDRVVHHATILELNGESYRAKKAGERNPK